MKKLSLLTALLLCMAVFGLGQTSQDYNILIEDLEFQPGVTIDININVYVNEHATNMADHGKIFAIEGMAHTANCWKPFAEALFEVENPALEINEFYAIDMPGRGGSGVPEGYNPASGDDFKLADMYMEDFICVIRKSIAYLNDVYSVRPNTIMGHSLGGLEVIKFQELLVQEGSNLRKELGIKNAILLAPAIPAPIDWAFLSAGAGQLIPLAHESDELGWILDIPYYQWPFFFFTNTCCYFPPAMVPGAPGPSIVLANGYNSIEVAPLLFHMAGLPFNILPGFVGPTHHPYRPRISAERGIFMPKHGVELTIIADEFDRMMHPDEEMALYKHLTNDKHGNGVHVIEGEETCHDTHISDPHAVAALFNKPYFFKSIEAGEADESYINTLTIMPNPASGNVNIDFILKEDAEVSLGIFDARGTLVNNCDNAFYTAGHHRLDINLESLPAGLYFCKLQINNTIEVKKLVVK